jgi:predicted transglutaminase-like cysteine proteinase
MPQKLTKELWKVLKKINKEVNNDIRYKRDIDLYNQTDYWTIIEGKGEGDCDDYAITKIHRLVNESDWKRENLCIGVCKVEDRDGRPGMGEGHAVTIARTDRGDFVLDNRYRKVKKYEDLPYHWLAIEDYENKVFKKIVN